MDLLQLISRLELQGDLCLKFKTCFGLVRVVKNQSTKRFPRHLCTCRHLKYEIYFMGFARICKGFAETREGRIFIVHNSLVRSIMSIQMN